MNQKNIILVGIILLVMVFVTVGYFLLDKKQDSEKFYCQTNEDCVNYRACREVCVNRDYEKANPYDGPACGIPWRAFDCECTENKCEVRFK